jgi:hypothetical protein
MAEENTIENKTPEPSPVEQRAMEQGWVPQEQWEGSPDDWRPAKEFVDRGELLNKISEQKRELKSIRSAMEEFGKHHARVRQVEYERALASLKAQKKEALNDGNADAVIEIDEQIDAVKEEARQARQPTPQVNTEPDPVFTTWVNKNSWYNSERAMKAFADEVARETFANGERDRPAILAAVEKAVKKEFPHKFTNPNREKAVAVEGSTNKTPVRKDSIESSMNDAERAIMNKLVRTGAITKEKYLEEFKAVKSR